MRRFLGTLLAFIVASTAPAPSEAQLSRHQQFHLDAVIAEAEADKLKTRQQRDEIADNRGVIRAEYDAYNQQVIDDAKALARDASRWPPDLEPADIGDHLEHQTEVRP